MKAAAVAFFIAFAALPAAATRIARLSLEEIRDTAAAVIVVDIVDSAPRVGNAGMVWIDYRARVVEVLRGAAAAGEIRTLSLAGAVAGVPQLERGAHYIIFLDDAAARPVPAIGWGQGIFRLAGDRIVSVDGEQLAVDRHGRLVRVRTSDAHSQRLSDPLVVDADGSVRTLRTPVVRAVPQRPATLEDIRHFVR